MSDDAPETARVCNACGGTTAPCQWCYAGLQSPSQAIAFARAQVERRRLSGTSAVAEQLLLGVLERLDDAGEDELVGKGLRLHALWVDTPREERAALAKRIDAFAALALDRLHVAGGRTTLPSPPSEDAG